MLTIINDTEHVFNYFVLFFFSVDNLNKSTNGTNSVAANDGSGISLYVWVYFKCTHLKQHSIQRNVNISFEQIYVIEKTTTLITCLQEVNSQQSIDSCIYFYL